MSHLNCSVAIVSLAVDLQTPVLCACGGQLRDMNSPSYVPSERTNVPQGGSTQAPLLAARVHLVESRSAGTLPGSPGT